MFATDEMIDAATELYRNMALRHLRLQEKSVGEFDPMTYLNSFRPYTEEEAQGEAIERAANFRTIVARRNQPMHSTDPGMEPYLALGYDLIFEMPQGR